MSYLNLIPSNERKRSFVRADMRGQVIIHDSDRLFIAPLTNLSAGGAFIQSLVDIPVGKPIRIVIRSSQLQITFQAEGKVVRVENGAENSGKKGGLAVEFTQLSSEARIHILKTVSEIRLAEQLRAVA